MITSDSPYPRVSDWSTTPLESLENRDAWTRNNTEPTNINQMHKDDPFPNTLVYFNILSSFEKWKILCRSEKRCSHLHPCLQGLLLGLLSNLLILGVVLVLWLVPHNNIEKVPANRKCFLDMCCHY